MEVLIMGPSLGQGAEDWFTNGGLPEWFGVEEALCRYIRDVDVLPTFLAAADGEVVGFLTLREHNEYAAEIHVMAVRAGMHRRGIGRQLLNRSEQYLRLKGVEYLQVKTLSAAHPDKCYANTREFYHATGFRPLQEFPELWDPQSPCLLMVKYLAGETAGA